MATLASWRHKKTISRVKSAILRDAKDPYFPRIIVKVAGDTEVLPNFTAPNRRKTHAIYPNTSQNSSLNPNTSEKRQIARIEIRIV